MSTAGTILEKALVTWFGSGLLPGAPGTWGSLAALPFAYALFHLGGPLSLAVGVVAVSLIGWMVVNAYQERHGLDDPGHIVIDEVAGVWLTLTFAPPTLTAYALGFALFRLFDIAKPWPVNWADKQVGGGLGVMLDDILAGLYAAAILCLVQLAGWI